MTLFYGYCGYLVVAFFTYLFIIMKWSNGTKYNVTNDILVEDALVALVWSIAGIVAIIVLIFVFVSRKLSRNRV